MKEQYQLQPAVLLLDADTDARNRMAETLSPRCALLEAAASTAVARELMRRYHFDIVIADIGADGSGVAETLASLAGSGSGADLIATGSEAELSRVLESIRGGAVDFLPKPAPQEALLEAFGRCVARRRRSLERFGERGADTGSNGLQGVVATSDAMREVLELVMRVAHTSTMVLLEGETGSGKEVVARAIHSMSGRKGTFVAVNCGSISPELLESEMFGHVKGAYTGAYAARDGLFTHARDGTLFLDEISEMPVDLQAKLLRVLEQRTVRPVGADREIPVNARVVAATNRSLLQEMEQGRFREDLFYRMNVLKIEVPALRERPEDIAPLAQHFSRSLAAVHDVEPIPFDYGEIRRLSAYHWPGNVRELRNVIERALLLGRLPSQCCINSPDDAPSSSEPAQAGYPLEWSMGAVEKDHMLRVLESVGNNKSEAARRLGVSRKTLERKLAQWRDDASRDVA